MNWLLGVAAIVVVVVGGVIFVIVWHELSAARDE